MPAITVEELNNIDNIIAKGICIDPNKYLYFGKNEGQDWKKFYVDSNFHKNWLLYIYNLAIAEIYLLYRIAWCDVIIWQWDIKKYMPHYWFIKFSKKPVFVEWLGSDIRIPDLVKTFNKYYKSAWDNGMYTYTKESYQRSESIQKKFKCLNAIPILCPEMTLFLNRGLFPEHKVMMQRVNLSMFNIRYPTIEKNIPIICHAPSAIGAKGTKLVREVIEKLKSRIEFKYIEIIHVNHKEAIRLIEECDIFLDQFILGAYGMAACEAMSMGKPVFCFLMEEVKNLLPSECPLLSFGIDELEHELYQILLNPSLRNEIGIKSRKYMEDYHDSMKLTIKLSQFLVEHK